MLESLRNDVVAALMALAVWFLFYPVNDNGSDPHRLDPYTFMPKSQF
jgi:hypothetical protein